MSSKHQKIGGRMDKLLLLVALSLSVVSGIFSIIGLTAIFPASYTSIVVMGSLLEIAKVVSVSWLNRRWTLLNSLLKVILSVMVLLLMGITSLGVFGYLSKAHIDQQVEIQLRGMENVEILQSKIQPRQEELNKIEDQLTLKQSALSGLIKGGKEVTALKNLSTSDQRSLEKKREKLVEELAPLKEELIKASGKQKKLEAEVGPLKYLVNLVNENPSPDQLEKAVMVIITTLVLVFDPFAILMLVAYNTVKKKQELVGFSQEKTVNLKEKTVNSVPEPEPKVTELEVYNKLGRPIGARDKFPPRKRKIVRPSVKKVPLKKDNVQISKRDLLDLQKFKATKRSGGQIYILTPPKTKKPRKKKT